MAEEAGAEELLVLEDILTLEDTLVLEETAALEEILIEEEILVLEGTTALEEVLVLEGTTALEETLVLEGTTALEEILVLEGEADAARDDEDDPELVHLPNRGLQPVPHCGLLACWYLVMYLEDLHEQLTNRTNRKLSNTRPQRSRRKCILSFLRMNHPERLRLRKRWEKQRKTRE